MSAHLPVNIRRVAEKAGVAPITVSRALRNAPNVSEPTRQKVVQAAESLGYKPDPLVSAYASRIRQSRPAAEGGVTLAWLSSDGPDDERPWIAPFQRGVVKRSAELGFDLDETVYTGGMSGNRVRQLLEARGVRGIVIPNLHYYGDEIPDLPSIVSVGIGPSMAERPQHNVSVDAFINVGVIFSRLLTLGYERIGFCEHTGGTFNTQGQAMGGYLFHQHRIAEKHRIPPLIGLDLGNECDASRKEVLNWVDRYQPDAVITGFCFLRGWLEEAGQDVPGDIGITHYSLADDTPGWSGVDPRPEMIGAAAVDLLTAHILRNEYGTPAQPKRMRFGGRWVQGATTRKQRDVFVPQDVEPPGYSHSLEWYHHEFF